MAAKAGWFPDPYDTTQYAGFRFWDGSAWTAKVLPYKPLVVAAPGSAMVRTATGAEIASLKRRFVAWILDGFLSAIVTGFVAFPVIAHLQRDMLLAFMPVSGRPAVGAALVADVVATYAQLGAISGLVGFVYAALMTGFFSATVGKLALGVRVVARDGSRVRWWQAAVRALVPNAPLLGAVLVPLLGSVSGLLVLFEWLTALVSGRKQSIHDYAAGTVVVRR